MIQASAPLTDAPSRKGLSLTDVVAQSIGFMGPVFSVSILLPLLIGVNAAGRGAGAAAPLAVLLATVGILAVGWIVATYARRVNAAGSLYHYVTLGLGERTGVAAGYVYYGGILLLGAALGPLIGGFAHDTLLAEFQVEPLTVWQWQLLFLAIVLVIVFAGVELSVRSQLALAVVSVAVLVVFFVHVIIQVGDGNSLKAFDPRAAQDGWGGILFAVLYGVLLFTGFESAANLAEEAKDPHRYIPKAVLFSVLVAAAFFVLGAYAQVAGFGFSLDAMAGSAAAPLGTLAGGGAGGYGSVAWGRLVELVVLLDILAVFIGVSVSATRGLLTVARDGWLPRFLATVNLRRGAPVGALALLGVVYLAVIAISNLTPGAVELPGAPPYLSIYSWCSTFGIFCLAAVYLLMALGAPRGLRAHAPAWLIWPCSLVAAVTTGGALFGAVYQVPEPTVTATYSAMGWFVLAVIATLVVARRRAGGRHSGRVGAAWSR